MDASRIGDTPHETVEGIDLAHKMSLAEPSNGWVAGQLSHGREGMRYERRHRAHACSGGRGFAPGVAAAHNNHIEGLIVHSAFRSLQPGQNSSSDRSMCSRSLTGLRRPG